MGHPYFSIIIPVYNTERSYLDGCMESVLRQTFSDFEVLLVDDGSGEPCRSLCEGYASEDERVRLLRQENAGVSAARNNGLQSARADWILFVDGDDWLEPDALERLAAHLEEKHCDILQFCAVKEYADRREKLHYGYEPGRMYDTADTATREFLYRRFMAVGAGLCTPYYSWDKVIRRAFLQENGLAYPVGVPKSEDKVFFLRCLEKLGTFGTVEDELYHYRIIAASTCRRYTEKADENCTGLADHLMEIAERMDGELAALTGQPDYDRLRRDCRRFLFGILTDVLHQKFYHPENPQDKKTRTAQANEFLAAEPFRTAIRDCSYGELSAEAKLKKFLLTHGWPGVFCGIRNAYNRICGRKAQ